jgi:hypothetical protein
MGSSNRRRPLRSSWRSSTTKYLNVTTQYLHELNERVPLKLVAEARRRSADAGALAER